MSQNMSSNGKLRSEQIVVSSPMSFTGSAKRIWKLTDQDAVALRILLIPICLILTFVAWIFVAIWTVIFGIFMIPYRIFRRGSRKDKVRNLQHREQLEALTAMQQQQVIQTAQIINRDNPKP